MAKLAVSTDTRALIEKVTNKRARFVLDSILQNGMVTTEEIRKAGYSHEPRAARDVRELGFPLKTLKVKHSNGRSIAAYTLDIEKLQNLEMAGRRALSKKERQRIIDDAGGVCQICSSTLNLQVDHRIPYQVAGESMGIGDSVFQVLCGVQSQEVMGLRALLECSYAERYESLPVLLLVWIGFAYTRRDGPGAKDGFDLGWQT
jgi:hypothetical protein